MSTTRTAHEQAAYGLGVEHAKNAASWALDGSMSTKDITRRLSMMDDGDPAVYDLLPAMPDLSGEYADDLSPIGLVRVVTGEHIDDIQPEDADAIADAYEAGVSDTFESECERILRAAL